MITLYNKRQFILLANTLSKAREPFFFSISFDTKSCILVKLCDIQSDQIAYKFNGKTNVTSTVTAGRKPTLLSFEKYPEPYENYLKGYKKVAKNIQYGNSFLLNYTCRTPIKTNFSLHEIFLTSKAKYAVYIKDLFTFFSPETFIMTRDNTIITNPMKGTIDANLPEAEQLLLRNEKETAEHYTIVDLLRNDLAMVAHHVLVRRFKYLEKIHTSHKTLLQMSSEITGDLPAGWQYHLGELLFTLLPAGSITGAPKKKTLGIIKSAEILPRGFYTGISGIFDGTDLDTCVNIRFVAQEEDGLYYHSGGGITCNSLPEQEYQEMIDKIYLSI